MGPPMTEDVPEAEGPLHYQLLFEQHPDAMFAMNVAGRVVAGNQAFAELVGEPLQALTGGSALRFVDPGDVARVRAEFRASLAGRVRSYDVRGLDRHEQAFHVSITHVPVTVDDEVTLVYAILRDI